VNRAFTAAGHRKRPEQTTDATPGRGGVRHLNSTKAASRLFVGGFPSFATASAVGSVAPRVRGNGEQDIAALRQGSPPHGDVKK